MEKEKMLLYLKPIWKAKGWDFENLKKKPYKNICAIYYSYRSQPQKTNKIIKSNNKKYEQLKLSI